MAIKNTLLGGSDFVSPARVKPTDLNDTFDACSKFIDLNAMFFKNYSQLLFNSAYIGFGAKLNVASGVPNLENIKYDIFNTDTSYEKIGLISYDSSDKLFKTLDLSTITYYVIVEASSYSGSAFYKIANGKWILYTTTAGELGRAIIMEQLWGNQSGLGEMSKFTSVTAIKVSDSNDVGYRGHHIDHYASVAGTSSVYSYVTGTFAITSGNTVSSWSYLTSGGEGNTPCLWDVPSGTNLNSANASTSDEIGLDKSADEKTNPANCRIGVGVSGSSYTPRNYHGYAIIFCKGGISWNKVDAGCTGYYTATDYSTTYSLPDTTQADTLVNEGVGNCSVEFRTTSLPTITDLISTWNSLIDADNTLTVSISADGTNYEEVDDITLHRFTNTGTNLFVKFSITRVDTSAVDKISEYSVWYNTGVSI